jgi:hypothetical protein
VFNRKQLRYQLKTLDPMFERATLRTSNRKCRAGEDVLVNNNLNALTNERFIHDRKSKGETGAGKHLRVQ